MKRRQVLEWLSRGIATVVATVVGVPGIRFLAGTASSASATAADFRRLKRLQDIPLDHPVMVPIVGFKQDGWVQSDDVTLGRVWLVRTSTVAAEAGDSTSTVKAFSSVCPHMGCQIQTHAASRGFVCPCHRAAFDLDGQRQTNKATKERNHAPRDMDSMECHIVRDATSGDDWVEVKFALFQAGSERRVIRN